MSKRIVRVFPRRTKMTPDDPLAFVGDPPLWRPKADEVHVSVAFTWDVTEGERLAEAWGLYYPIVKLGGPALSSACNAFVPGRFIKQGVTFTTRGCNRHCPWCLVPEREGRLREIKGFTPGHIIQDNNLLQADRPHLRNVFAMLKAQRRAAELSGGLDARLVDDWVAEMLRGLRIKQLFLAADSPTMLRPLQHAISRLAWLPKWRRRVFALIGFDGETISQATDRLECIWQMGGTPFAQLYQPADHWIDYSREWKALARTWSRPAAMAAAHGGWNA